MTPLTWADAIELFMPLAGMTLILWSVNRMFIRPKPTPPAPPRQDRHTKAMVEHKNREALEQVMTEMIDLGQDLSARLETKIATINQLIDDADDRIRSLKSLQAQNEGHVLPSSDAPMDHLKNRFSEVYRLAQEGSSALEIAQQLGMRTGEVELILGLEEKLDIQVSSDLSSTTSDD